MARYVLLINWTDQGIRNAKETINRANAARQAFQTGGAQVIDIYWTVGPYDIMAIFEAPDEETATRLVLALGMGLCVATERKPGKFLLPLPLPPFCPAEPIGSNDLKPVSIDTVSGSIPRDFVPLPAAPFLHAAVVWQTRSCSVSYGVYGRPFALACAPRPDRPSSARQTHPFSDATASSGIPWPWRSSTSMKARSGWVPSLTSMLAAPVVTTVRNRPSHGSERASDISRIRSLGQSGTC